MIKAFLYPMLIFLVAVTAMLAGNAQAAKFDVPQGDEKLPTIALIECLAEENSRSMDEYCYTTYSCSPARDGDGMRMPGTLWRGLPYHDSQRVTTADDDIAFGRSCVITVADDAKVTWFTGYRPDGMESEVVGIVKSRIETMGSYNTMLAQFLSHATVRANTLNDWIYRICWSFSGVCHHDNRNNGSQLNSIPATQQSYCYLEYSIAHLQPRVIHRAWWLHHIVEHWSSKRWSSGKWRDACPDTED